MSKIFFWSDLHLGHKWMYQEPFLSRKDNKSRMRHFKTATDADKYMVDQYNRVVNPGDTVYFLGDIVMSRSGFKALGQMNKGTNILVMGNHDKYEQNLYRPYFSENRIRGAIVLKEHKIVLTHFPIHPLSLKMFPAVWSEPRWDYNIHGHTHDWELPDNRYRNVSVEITGYKPLALEEVLPWNYVGLSMSEKS